eukprot:Skav234626  [mRNA]  locus=scaffold171:88028:89164:- [translate_table: standard]
MGAKGPEVIRIHLCGSMAKCVRQVEANGFIHGIRIRLKKEEDKGGWSENMKEEVDELARVRAWPIERGREKDEKEKEKAKKKEDSSSDSKEKKKKKKKKKKEEKDAKSKEKKDKKRARESESVKGPGQKTLEACFQGTGLDPSAKVRARVRRRARRKLKKRKGGGSSDGGDSSSSSSSSASDKSAAEDVFQDEQKVRLLARVAPGVLSSTTIRAMQEQLLTDQGTMMHQDLQEVPALALQYFRNHLQRKLAGGAMREALNLCWSVDLLLRGHVAAATDTLLQRVKALELIGGGAAWTVAQRIELVPPEKAQLSSRGETQQAVREQQAEQKVKSQTKGKEKGKMEGYGSWKGQSKGEGKTKDRGKGKKGDREEGKKNAS